MSMSSNSTIRQLQSGRRFKGTCPSCNETFFFSDVVLFAVDDATPPEQALAAIELAKDSLRQSREDLARARERMSSRAQRTAEAVNLGKIVEKIVPSFSSFTHCASDCRALFEPIDYIIFEGLSRPSLVESVLFVDVKSGQARLTSGQKMIKSAVEQGKIEFEAID